MIMVLVEAQYGFKTTEYCMKVTYSAPTF